MQGWIFLIFLITFDIGGRFVALLIMGIGGGKGGAVAKWLIACLFIPFAWAFYLIFGTNSYDIEKTGKRFMKDKDIK